AVARRQCKHRGPDGRPRSNPVHAGLRLVHRSECPRDPSGDAVLRRRRPDARIGGPRGPNNASCGGGGGFRRCPGCGSRQLDGLGVALPGIWPGAVHLGHGTQLVLIDGRATPAQRKALETLGKGEAGGPFAVFASVTEHWLPTIVAQFDVRLNGIRSTVRVDSGKVYDLALSRIKNPVTGEEEELYLDKPTGVTAKRSELGMSTAARFKAP